MAAAPITKTYPLLLLKSSAETYFVPTNDERPIPTTKP